jgi:hypothetical protein
MDGTLHEALELWGDFYLITGTAAAALTGLQFVVQTLIASDARRAVGSDPEAGIAAFGTPTVVHFAMTLVLACLLSVPWPTAAELRATLVVLGAGALVYSAIVLRRARRQKAYEPVGEDWLWHVILPALSYAGVLIGGGLMGHGATGALFAIAAASLVLLCAGIHNAWDTVTYLTLAVARGQNAAASRPAEPPEAPGPSREPAA